MANDQIKEGNTVTAGNDHMLLCNRYDTHDTPWTTYETYKNENSSSMGIMEHLWTVYAKPSTP